MRKYDEMYNLMEYKQISDYYEARRHIQSTMEGDTPIKTGQSNYRNGNDFLAWDLSQMPPGQSFEMTQEKPVSLILKLRRANNFVINVIVYSEYDSEIEMMNNRKVICHEYA